MNMKKLTLASVIMLALTGCGSNGGGSSNSTLNAEVNNNQATQAQVQQQKAEVEALKTQLAQAQANQKQAEDKLKAAEQTQNKDLTEAKKNLASAQENLTQAQSALKQAESQSSANQKTKDELQKQLNQVEQSLSKAQQEKLLAEKELNNKLVQDKTMTRAEVLDFALHNGLWAGDSEEFADNFQNKPKSYVIDQLLDTHKRIAIKRLARSYGLPEADVRVFAKENQNKTLDESTKILESKREEIAQKREALNKEVFELAKSKGLEEWEAHNFAYGRHHSGKEEALKELNKYVTEKAERETKINELINLAKEKGLEDWEARNFAYSNVNNKHTKMLENLNQLAAEKEKYRLQAEKEQKIRDLAEQYRTNYFGNASFDVYSFTEKYKDKTLEEAKAELDQFKTNREKVAELAKVLTELKVSDYTIEQFINDNTFLSLENAQANLDKKVTETINILKNSIYNNPSYGGTPLDKPLGFLSKEDLVTKKDPIIENDRETDRFTTTTTYSDIYNQKYSVVTGNYHKQDTEYKEFEYYYEDGDDRNSSPSHYRYVNKTRTTENYDVNDARGFKTPVDKFPTEGKATYNGVAFDAKKQGQLKYIVNFTERKGSGAITGLDHIGDITLHEADLYKSASAGNMKIKGTAVANDWQNEGGVTGNYNVDFFGPNAEEIAGKMTLSQGQYKWGNNSGPSAPDKHINESVITIGQPINGNSYNTQTNSFDIGFGGTRGEIQK